jgi:hypothetical protein
VQCAQPDDGSRHAGFSPDPLTRKPRGGAQPPVYSRTNASGRCTFNGACPTVALTAFCVPPKAASHVGVARTSSRLA